MENRFASSLNPNIAIYLNLEESLHCMWRVNVNREVWCSLNYSKEHQVNGCHKMFSSTLSTGRDLKWLPLTLTEALLKSLNTIRERAKFNLITLSLTEVKQCYFQTQVSEKCLNTACSTKTKSRQDQRKKHISACCWAYISSLFLMTWQWNVNICMFLWAPAVYVCN